MNKIWNKLTRLSIGREYTPPRIKPNSKQFDILFKEAADKGLELYADTNCKVYWLWKDGNSIEGTYDGFNTLTEVKNFLKTYQP